MVGSTTKWVVVLAFLVVVSKGHPLNDQYTYNDDPSDYDYGDDEEIEVDKEISVDVNFINSGETFHVDKGTTIRLPCYIDTFPENFVIMWKKVDESNSGNPQYLAIGERSMMNKEKRFSVEISKDGSNKGSTLVIGLADEGDAGQYVCQLGSTDKGELKHTVKVRDPPTIEKTPKNGLIKVFKGDDIFLSCIGNGNPKPKITWTRANKKLPDGREEIEGTELSFKNVDRRHSGLYICKADNGYGTPATQKIHVTVGYVPEVEVEEYFIHAAESQKVELVCSVHAEPHATVKWFKNSVELTGDTNTLQKHGHRHTLTIPTMTDSDFGNYTCRASNIHGVGEKNLEVSGLAGYADFKSSPSGIEPTSFVLEWSSESQSPITEFELNWREEGGEMEIFTVPSHKDNSFNWSGKYALNNLKPATRYEAKVLAKNDQGWSRPCPSFHFATFGAEPYTNTVKGSAAISRSNLAFTILVTFSVRYLINH